MSETYVYDGKEVKLTGRTAAPKAKPQQQQRRRSIPQQGPSLLVEVETVCEYEQKKTMWVKEDDLMVITPAPDSDDDTEEDI